MHTSFRIFRTKNLTAVRQLDSTLWVDDETDTFIGHELWLVRGPTGKLVGYAALKLVDGGHTGYLAKVGLMHEARGHGLQKRLIRVRERRARELGAKTVITYTSTTNMPSINSLVACGYRVYRPAREYGFKFGQGLYFRKELQPRGAK